MKAFLSELINSYSWNVVVWPGSIVAQFADSSDNIYMLVAVWKVRIWKTVTEVLKMLPKAAGWGQHFQAWGGQITYLFLSYDKIGLQVGLRNSVIELAGLTCRLRTIEKI